MFLFSNIVDGRFIPLLCSTLSSLHGLHGQEHRESPSALLGKSRMHGHPPSKSPNTGSYSIMKLELNASSFSLIRFKPDSEK